MTNTVIFMPIAGESMHNPEDEAQIEFLTNEMQRYKEEALAWHFIADKHKRDLEREESNNRQLVIENTALIEQNRLLAIENVRLLNKSNPGNTRQYGESLYHQQPVQDPQRKRNVGFGNSVHSASRRIS